ncbi:Calpain-1 catalytic subunit [Liparis tanakae]|uniref:Calpain-1 catalytic subunit n=1 Tax=Liparis tanakae TaxID=230148 RepID=A0A4Z2E854_9TELE|nr:Calpain-1 catalytic subunit [Liparis tanakae]
MQEQLYATGMAAKLRSQWDRDEGLGQNHKAVKFQGQDFEGLKAQSVQSGRLFEDQLFPCAAASLGFKELGRGTAKTAGVRWMRPPVRRGGGRQSSHWKCDLFMCVVLLLIQAFNQRYWSSSN